MEKINAVITGVGGYVPDYVLNNDELSRMVDTNDEWIMSRVGIKERRILNEEGLGSSYMARKAVKQLLEKTKTAPEDVDCLILATITPDYPTPSTASIVVGKLGLTNCFAYDISAACSGFLFAMEQAVGLVQSGRYKKVIVCCAEKLSSIVDYTDRNTCALFGDGAAAVMVEPTTEDYGWKDSILRTDGVGLPFLCVKGGGSACPPSHFSLAHRMHYLHQEGRTVYKFAVSNMTETTTQIVERNGLSNTNIDWVVPHQANVRIIQAVADRLEVPMDKVMLNIEHFGNTSGATIPLALWEYEKQLKKGDNLVLTAFGAGFCFGSAYVKWGYDGDKI